MIVSSFVDRLNQFISWLSERQWAEWEILTIAVIALFVLLWIIRWQRKRAIRNIYDNQFLESTPVIGANLGAHKRSHHVIEDLKKGRLAAAQKRHSKQQKSTKQTEPSEKLHEQIKQLQYEIIKRKQIEVRLEQQVAHLTAASEKLQRELAENKQAEQYPEQDTAEEPAANEQLQTEVPGSKQAEQQIAQEPATDEKQQPEIPESEQAGQDIEEQTDGIPATDKPGERGPARRGKTYEDQHRVVDGVKQKLCRKCKEWKPESKFHKNASSKDGLAGSCKTCKAEAAREYRKRRKAAKG
jgi:hypothetical protein